MPPATSWGDGGATFVFGLVASSGTKVTVIPSEHHGAETALSQTLIPLLLEKKNKLFWMASYHSRKLFGIAKLFKMPEIASQQ